MRKIIIFFLLILAGSLQAETQSDWYQKSPDGSKVINLKFFMSSTCPYCHKADKYLKKLEKEYKWLKVQKLIINKDKKSLVLFNENLAKVNQSDFRVPSFFFCGVRWVGFDTADTTGKNLEKGLKYCHKQLQAEGTISHRTEEVLNRWAPGSIQVGSDKEGFSTSLIMIGMAVLDALAPCAFFLFILFLSFLWLSPTRGQQIKNGLLVLAGIVLVHYFQQSQAELYYQLLGWWRIPALILGLILTLYVIVLTGSLSFNLLTAFVVLASTFSVGMYQQVCIDMNLSLIFQEWLNNQSMSAFTKSLYQISYQFVYLLPMILIGLINIFIFNGRRLLGTQQTLKGVGQLSLFVIGIILMIHPQLLASLYLSLILISAIFIIGIVAGLLRVNR